MLRGPISFCHNSKIYLDVFVIAYNRIAWGLVGGGGGGGGGGGREGGGGG